MKKIALGVLGFFAVLCLFFTVEHFRGKWGLSRWKARMAAKGEPLTIAAVVSPLPPVNQNGMPALNIAAGQIGIFPSQLLPPLTNTNESTPGKRIIATRLASWRSRDKMGTNVTWEMLGEVLKPLEAVLNSAVKALASPEFNANLDYYSGWGTWLPHLSRLRHLEWALKGASLHRFHGGDFNQGVEFTSAVIRAPAALKEEACMISHIVRFVIAREAFEMTWQAAHVEGLNDVQLRQLQDVWTEQDFLKPLRRALAMEHVMTSHEYRRMRNSEISVYDWLEGYSSPPPPRPLMINSALDYVVEGIQRFPQFFQGQVFSPIWKYAWSCQDELRFAQTVEYGLKTWDAAIGKQSAVPFRSLGDTDYLSLMDTSGTPEPMTIRYLLSPRASRFFPAMKRAFAAQTLRELAIAGLALSRYELRHGKPAPSLEALVPEFLPAVPSDLMDGKTLKYELRNGVMTLYSSGLDARGDTGDLRSLIWSGPAAPEEDR